MARAMYSHVRPFISMGQAGSRRLPFSGPSWIPWRSTSLQPSPVSALATMTTAANQSISGFQSRSPLIKAFSVLPRCLVSQGRLLSSQACQKSKLNHQHNHHTELQPQLPSYEQLSTSFPSSRTTKLFLDFSRPLYSSMVTILAPSPSFHSSSLSPSSPAPTPPSSSSPNLNPYLEPTPSSSPSPTTSPASSLTSLRHASPSATTSASQIPHPFLPNHKAHSSPFLPPSPRHFLPTASPIKPSLIRTPSLNSQLSPPQLPFSPNWGHTTQVRSFFMLPDFGSLKNEFFDPDRQGASSIITMNTLVFMATAWSRRLFNLMVQNNYLIAKGEWWRLLTAPLLHGGILHLLGNQLAIHYLSPAIEGPAGRTAYAAIYLAGALGGGLAHYHFASFASLAVGSSGGIAGIFAAFVVYKFRNRNLVAVTQQDKSFILQMVALNALLSFAMSGSIAHMAHLGGLAGGAVASWLVGPRYVLEWGRPVNRPLMQLPP